VARELAAFHHSRRLPLKSNFADKIELEFAPICHFD